MNEEKVIELTETTGAVGGLDRVVRTVGSEDV
jgi:hypothetical protein